MLREELGYGADTSDPVRAAAATFLAFVCVGFFPLAAFVAPSDVTEPFAWSAALTAFAFMVVGALKARFVEQTWWRSGLWTLGVGGVAAALAYAVGAALGGVARRDPPGAACAAAGFTRLHELGRLSAAHATRRPSPCEDPGKPRSAPSGAGRATTEQASDGFGWRRCAPLVAWPRMLAGEAEAPTREARGGLARAGIRGRAVARGDVATGLTDASAAERLAAVGPNVTGGHAGERAATVLLRQVANPLIAVLLVSGTIVLALGDFLDGAAVLGVVVANTLIGFVQEWRAGRAIEALASSVDGAPGGVAVARRVPVACAAWQSRGTASARPTRSRGCARMAAPPPVRCGS